jgi:hypothetical protein
VGQSYWGEILGLLIEHLVITDQSQGREIESINMGREPRMFNASPELREKGINLQSTRHMSQVDPEHFKLLFWSLLIFLY